MKYLSLEKMRAIDSREFQTQQPFPWINPQGFLTDAGYSQLLENMPGLDLFDSSFGMQRDHGQKSHDRYVLEYEDGLDLPADWQAFVDELRSKAYRSFIGRMLGIRHVRFRFHWHYTPRGCAVSPHCDSRLKLGSHIFYMNPAGEWDPAWGGETVILDDHGRFDTASSPAFEDFDEAFPAQTMDNRSLIFGRRGNSWHGVREIDCPEGSLRKVFIVVFREFDPKRVFAKRFKRLVKRQPLVKDNERNLLRAGLPRGWDPGFA